MSALAAASIADHHKALARRLAQLTAAVQEAVSDGDDGDTEALAVFSWYRNELLPQLKAVEAAVYPRGRERESTAVLVQALIADQARMRAAFERLDAVDGPGDAAATAGAARALFEAQIAKEAEQLLPELVRIGVDFGVVIDEHPELAGGDRKRKEVTAQLVTDDAGAVPTIEPVTGTEELDVRPLAHDARHGLILGKMRALTASGRLIVINDHDPLPLKYQAEAMWPHQFAWTYVAEGPEEWRVAIARV